MNNITQKMVENAICTLSFKQIKQIIGRRRLHFSIKKIGFYCHQTILHTVTQKRYIALYKSLKNPQIKYSTYMNNIALFSRLFRYLFDIFNKTLGIKPSKLLNIIDSTLIDEKATENINQKDWDSGRVTTRTKNKQKVRTCGSKAFVIINRKKQITHMQRCNINDSDQNYLKNPYVLGGKINGILLADRGFGNKIVRERLASNKNDILKNYGEPICRFVSPYRKNQNIELTEKEKKLYKRRWKIETLFQVVKDTYSSVKLNLRGKYKDQIKDAKLYASAIIYNFSTITN